MASIYECAIVACAASLFGCGARASLEGAPSPSPAATDDASSDAECFAPAITLTTDAPLFTHLGAFVLDSTGVYWADASRNIATVPKAGGVTRTVVGSADAEYVAVDETYAYYDTDYGLALSRSPLAGGTPTRLVSVSAVPLRIAVNASHLYYLVLPYVGARETELWSIPKGGGTPELLLTGLNATDFVVDDDTIVFKTVNESDDTVGGASMRVEAIAVAGGMPIFLGEEGPIDVNTASIAMDATSIYWQVSSAYHGEASITKVPKSGGAKTRLNAPPVVSFTTERGRRFAVGRTHFYWVSNDSILRMPKVGGAVTVVETNQEATTLAVDDSGLYWATGVQPTVLKRRKGCE